MQRLTFSVCQQKDAAKNSLGAPRNDATDDESKQLLCGDETKRSKERERVETNSLVRKTHKKAVERVRLMFKLIKEIHACVPSDQSTQSKSTSSHIRELERTFDFLGDC
jgi:hypothetical protein